MHVPLYPASVRCQHSLILFIVNRDIVSANTGYSRAWASIQAQTPATIIMLAPGPTLGMARRVISVESGDCRVMTERSSTVRSWSDMVPRI
mgnify:CR=1 FL=1